ncbi:MAG: hypothetical protein ACK4PR_05160, partial [Gammaproteobacteria bacterium]
IPSDTPKHFSSLIQQCWSGEPSQRPTAQEAIKYLEMSIETAEKTGYSAATQNVSSPGLVSNNSDYRGNLDSTVSPYNSGAYASGRNSGNYSAGLFHSQTRNNDSTSAYASNLSSTASGNYTDNLASEYSYKY